MKQSEELYLLRYRYGRAAEMLVAYKTFLSRQVQVGPENYCQNSEIVSQVTHTLLITYYSFIHSLFDQSGTNFIKTTEPYLSILTDDALEIRNELIEIWQENREAISKLRNNVGFHGGTKLRSHEVGYSSFGLIHPQTPDLIMTCFALFFIEIDKVVVPEGNFKKHVDTEPVKKFMRERSEKLKKAIKDPSRQEAFNLLIEELKDMYGE